MMDNDISAVFLEEASELLESLEQGLLKLQADPNNMDLINAAFRDLHTIKGSGAMFGFTDLAAFIHKFETAFEKIRSGEIKVSASLIRVALRAADEIKGYLAGEAAMTPARQAILDDLAQAVSPGNDTVEPHVEAPAEQGWRLDFRLATDALALGARPEVLLDELRGLGATNLVADISRIPALEGIEAQACLLGWSMDLPASAREDDINSVFMFHEGNMELNLVNLAAPAPDVTASAVPAEVVVTGPQAAQQSATMRVPAERLDELMDQVGELVIAEARLSALANSSKDPSIMAAAEDIQRLSARMRDTTMSIRMVPISSIIGRFRRLVHDLSEGLGKTVDFVVTGADTELDKTVIERLGDPLVHIIRNAIDHGLETDEARAAAGKPDRGTIELSAEHLGAEVVISVKDNGRGLDRNKLRARAIDQGLLTPDATPSEAELFALILEPGFSTAAKVTELSGRGVGMDVVKRTVEGLRGRIVISSEPGHGTTFTLRLPLTLSIIEGLLVDVGGDHYIIPMAAVQEIVELPACDTADDTASSFLQIRDSLVPFLRLRTLLDCAEERNTLQNVIVVSASSMRVGLVVDRILGTNQTVVKQMSRLHAGVKSISGATILGDGSVALVLEVGNLVELARTDLRKIEKAA
ncbi:chemotaxis protein CheA [uncultured Roseovarius sp.]|uniref:chemotaxis protein CheA n=1 Tax=uncultured Roseovarius sp. TaxID=293344 RepID=UPI000C39570F|nr:chemotaxis protein CheA [Roseovarius sp.]MBD12591.1 chemotaxis protein CheA [Roseovarius sp.]|tara:strand:+ start:941 stop:2866 length:1926 start_codon:yes stop_codon:yes gene_type:complete